MDRTFSNIFQHIKLTSRKFLLIGCLTKVFCVPYVGLSFIRTLTPVFVSGLTERVGTFSAQEGPFGPFPRR